MQITYDEFLTKDNSALTAHQQYLSTIPKQQTNELLKLFKELYLSKNGEDILPYTTFYQFHKLLYDLKFIFDFDWMQWKMGHANLSNPEYDFSRCSSLQLCMYLTVIFRSNHYCEGNIENYFSKGQLHKIFSALELTFQNNK